MEVREAWGAKQNPNQQWEDLYLKLKEENAALKKNANDQEDKLKQFGFSQ